MSILANKRRAMVPICLSPNGPVAFCSQYGSRAVDFIVAPRHTGGHY